MPGYPGRTKNWIAALIVASLTACGDGSTSPDDTIAPTAISDLHVTDSLGTSITLTWTASGDDSLVGTGSEYDLRYSLSPIGVANWRDAWLVTDMPTPAAAGTTQEMTVSGLGWWKQYFFALRVVDEAGNWSRISNIVVASPHFEEELRFLVQTAHGILAVDENANAESFIGSGIGVEIEGDRVFTATTGIEEYDLDGVLLRRIAIPDAVPRYSEFSALPGGRFALMSNVQDSIYFIDGAGGLLAVVSMQIGSDPYHQSNDGVVVGDSLVVSHRSPWSLLSVDLSTFEIAVFPELSDQLFWLPAIDYSDGYYYICHAQSIYYFGESGPLEMIAELPEDLHDVTSIVVAGGFSFVTVFSPGAIYGVHNATGKVISFLEGLADPEDLELLPP